MALSFSMPDFSSPIYKYIRQFWQMLIFTYRAQKEISPSYFRSLSYAFKLYFKESFNPRDAYLMGFLSKDFVYGSHENYISKNKMASIQNKVNPSSWNLLTEDKGIFYRICEKMNIPTPKLYGLVFKDSLAWSFLDSKTKGREDWDDFSIHILPNQFVIKPAKGAYGRKIKIYKRSGNTFIDEKKAVTSPDQIYNYMIKDPLYDCFVIQERLFNHRDLVDLSGSEYLQTMRMITYINRNGDIKIIDAFFKPIVGKNITDNHDHGKTGNLLARMDMDKGTLQPAVFMGSHNYGIKAIANHPDTGVSFSGFAIPLWHDACSLVLSVARQFAPIRTVGWDIAITPTGPVVVEGNFTYDPPAFGDVGLLLSELKT